MIFSCTDNKFTVTFIFNNRLELIKELNNFSNKLLLYLILYGEIRINKNNLSLNEKSILEEYLL